MKIQNRMEKENVTFFRFGVCVGKPLIDCGLREGPPSCALYTQARGTGTDRILVHGVCDVRQYLSGRKAQAKKDCYSFFLEDRERQKEFASPPPALEGYGLHRGLFK